jgi:hypothetical protein
VHKSAVKKNNLKENVMQTRTKLMAIVFALVVLLGGTPSVFAQEPCADAQPESCVICHEGAGAAHQASYDELYQDGVIVVTDMAYEYSAPNTHIITFTMTKDGEPFDPADADRVRMYFVPYTGTAFQFEPAGGRLRLDGTMTYDGAGGVTSTLTDDDPRYASSFEGMDGAIMLYGLIRFLPPTTMAAKNATRCHTLSTVTTTPRLMMIPQLISSSVKPATWKTLRAAITNGSFWSTILKRLLNGYIQTKTRLSLRLSS